MLEVKKLSLDYSVGGQNVQVLKNLDFKVNAGDFVGIQGPSGSGKSTLFYILGFLLKPTSGSVRFDGQDILELSEDQLTVLRNQRIGFVFQQFHLLSNMSVLENILLPTRYPSEFAQAGPENLRRARELAKQFGLEKHLHHLPNQLSGGQQQRVAISRALMNDVDLILADEPTGNLDSQNAAQILDLLTELNRQGKTIILITHDSEVAKRCAQVYHMKDGVFTHQVENFKSSQPSEKKRPRGPVQVLPQAYTFTLYRRILRSVFPLMLQNLLRNKAKSILTMLGVVIGVAAVLAMSTLGQFTKRKILESYEAMGVNKILLRGYPNWNMKATDKTSVNFKSFNWDKDGLPLLRIFPEIRSLSPELTAWRGRATAGGLEVGDNKVASMGVTEDHLAITNRTLLAGRNISPFHVQYRSPVCLIGFEIANRLFSRTKPIGQMITVTDGQRLNYPCRVIGVLAPLTQNNDWAPPNLHVILPYTYFQTVGDWWSSQIHELVLQIHSGDDVEKAAKKIKAYFDQKYGKSGMFMVDSDSTMIAQMKRFLTLFTVLLAAIALLSLVVGGIGINNMMLVSVTERIREFGIRKALGATRQSIRMQVLMESTALCVVAGIMGVFIGFCSYELVIFGATQFVPKLKFEWVIEPISMILSVVSIGVVGISSGLVPALRAEKLQVIEALRSE